MVLHIACRKGSLCRWQFLCWGRKPVVVWLYLQVVKFCLLRQLLRATLAAACLAVLLPSTAAADRILRNLALDDGATWEIVGLTLHNYQPHPLQKDLGTFVIADVELLQKLQQDWDLRLMFDDYCDWHYSLKIYRNRELVKTLKVNLVCGYITDGAFSYKFNPAQMEVFRDRRLRLPWSRIRYRNLDNLQLALTKLEKRTDVYFYNDIKPFRYNGWFHVGIEKQALRVNRDSLDSAVTAVVKKIGGGDDVYVTSYLMSIDDKSRQLAFRYTVYCDEVFAKRFAKAAPDATTALWVGGRVTRTLPWRAHTVDTPFLQLLVVGITQDKYWKELGLVPEKEPVYE